MFILFWIYGQTFGLSKALSWSYNVTRESPLFFRGRRWVVRGRGSESDCVSSISF